MKSLPAISIVIAWIMVCLGFGPVCLPSQTYNDLEPDSVILQFRDAVLTQSMSPKIKYAVVCKDMSEWKEINFVRKHPEFASRPHDFLMNEGFLFPFGSLADSVLTPSDSAFMAGQWRGQKTTTWKHTTAKVHPVYPPKTGLYPQILSLPLFSQDLQWAIAIHSVDCGLLCGETNYSLYHLENGKWIKKEHIWGYVE